MEIRFLCSHPKSMRQRSPRENYPSLPPAPPVLRYLVTLHLSSISLCASRCGLIETKLPQTCLLETNAQCTVDFQHLTVEWMWPASPFPEFLHLHQWLHSQPHGGESPDPREGSHLYPQFCGGIGSDMGPSWGDRLLSFGTPRTPKGLVASQWLRLWSKRMENLGATSAHAFSCHTASTFSVSQQHSLLGSLEKILWLLHRWLGVRTFEEIQDPQMRP